MRDDYALIILPKNIDGLTLQEHAGGLSAIWGSDPRLAVDQRLDAAGTSTAIAARCHRLSG